MAWLGPLLVCFLGQATIWLRQRAMVRSSSPNVMDLLRSLKSHTMTARVVRCEGSDRLIARSGRRCWEPVLGPSGLLAVLVGDAARDRLRHRQPFLLSLRSGVLRSPSRR